MDQDVRLLITMGMDQGVRLPVPAGDRIPRLPARPARPGAVSI